MSEPAAGDDGPLPPQWTAPADARELEDDLRALRREQAAAQRTDRSHGDPGVLRRVRAARDRYATPVVLTLLVLIGLVSVAAGLLVAAPVGLPSAPARPLASPSVRPGAAGGLLPEVTLRVGSTDRSARMLRPAVLAVFSTPCRCRAALGAVATEAGQYALPVVLITGTLSAEVEALLRATRATRTYPAVDRSSALARAYAARGLTVLLVRADGVVTVVEREFSSGRRLGSALSELSA